MLTFPTPKHFDPIGDILCHTQMRRKNAERVQELVDDLCDSYRNQQQSNRMTPDELIKVLKQ